MSGDRGRAWIDQLVPRLRRYASVMAGSDVELADKFLAEALAESISSSQADPEIDRLRVDVLRNLHRKFSTLMQQPDESLLGSLSPVEVALRRLEPDERSALLLLRFEQLSIEQIADVAGLSSAQAKEKIDKARQQVFDEVSDLMGTS